MAKLRPLSETKFINDANLVSYWKLDGNSNDSKGSNNGTDTSMSYSAGQFDSAGVFNGSSSIINLGYTAPTDNYTYSLWVNPTNFTAVRPIIHNFLNTGAGRNIFIATKITTGYVYVDIPYIKGDIMISPTGLTAGVWTNIVITRSGSTWNMYFNGALVKTVTDATAQESTTTCRFGKTNGADYLLGSLDDITLFSRALSSAEVNELYQGMTLGEFLGEGSATTKLLLHLNGNSTDSSGNSNNGTDTSITYSLANGRFGQGAGFNGSSSFITIPDNVSTRITGDITISMWIYSNVASNDTNWHTIIAKRLGLLNPVCPYSINFNNNSSGSNFQWFFADGTAYRVSNYTGATFPYQTWTNVVVTRASGIMNTYWDAVLLKTTDLSAYTPNMASGTLVTIGKEESAEFFNGNLDEVIISNYAWSAAKIAKYYSYAKGRYATL